MRDLLSRPGKSPGNLLVLGTPVILMESVNSAMYDEAAVQTKMVLRPLFGLMQGKKPSEIERYAVTEINKYRRLRDEAVGLEALLENADTAEEQTCAAERAYLSAMIAVHAQQTVVSTLLDMLDYVPELPGRKPR